MISNDFRAFLGLDLNEHFIRIYNCLSSIETAKPRFRNGKDFYSMKSRMYLWQLLCSSFEIVRDEACNFEKLEAKLSNSIFNIRFQN